MFSLFFGPLALALLAAAGYGVARPRSIPGRLIGTSLALANVRVRRFEQVNAQARLHRAIEQRAEAVEGSVEGLAEQQAHASRLERSVQELEAQVLDLRHKIKTLTADGVPNTDPFKLQLGQQLADRMERLEEKKQALARAREVVSTAVSNVQAQRIRIRDEREQAQELEADLRAAQIEQRGARLTAGLNDAGLEDEAEKARRDLQEAVDRARGGAAATAAVYGPDPTALRLEARVRDHKAAALLDALDAEEARQLAPPARAVPALPSDAIPSTRVDDVR